MKIFFSKYQGAGNDFVVIDNRTDYFDSSNTILISKLCDRRFGIGADGLMLLQNKAGYDFEMIYFNSDGNTGSMCGNGGRCIVDFSHQLGVTGSSARFLASDGAHEALFTAEKIKLKMNDVPSIETLESFYFLNTGSPHVVKFVSGLSGVNVLSEGKKIRNAERFLKEGTNVNFIELKADSLFVRTYERGVEAETHACGTGVTASALVADLKGMIKTAGVCDITTLGGKLKVFFKRSTSGGYTDVWLEGPAVKVYSGEIEV